MAHKTLIGGTAYNITGGKSLVSGTSYDIASGRTLIGGTGYDIGFRTEPAYAMLYSDGDFVIQRGNDVDEGKTLNNSYTGFENVEYTEEYSVPWCSQADLIKNVSFNGQASFSTLGFWFFNCINLVDVNYINLDWSKVTNIRAIYYDCFNLTGSPVCGDNVTDMFYTYWNCYNLTGSPVCGNNVTNMYRTYWNCYNLTGSPVCGDNVTNMSYTYYYCYNLTGAPVCGDNVTNMARAYYNCRNLTGSPVCGDNVTTMGETYYYCYNLTGAPVCGNNVTNMYRTYLRCDNLTGSPVCGNNVIDMSNAYQSCNKLTGSPVCGANVTNMYYTYSGCPNIGANGYFYSSVVSGARGCFSSKNNLRRLNLYVPANSTTQTTVLISNTYSLVGANITYTNAGSYYYNTTYNIYIYPVANVAAKRAANGD